MKIKSRFLVLPLIMLTISITAKNMVSVWEEIDQLNSEMRKYGFNHNYDVTSIFIKSLYLIESGKLKNEVSKLRQDAFEKNSFNSLENYSKRAMPIFKIVFGGEANYININTSYFMTKYKKDTIEYNFFKLANYGWMPRRGLNMQGGENNLPSWLIMETGVTGIDDSTKMRELLNKWMEIKPKMHGIFLEIANSTIEKLKKRGVSKADNLNCRSEPNLKSKILFQLMKNDKFETISQTSEYYKDDAKTKCEDQFNSMRNCYLWYKIKIRNKEGWIFGKYIDFEW